MQNNINNYIQGRGQISGHIVVRHLILVLVLFFICSCTIPGLKVNAQSNQKTETKEASMPSFKLTMLNVGQGSALLLESNEHYVLIDGGGRTTSDYVVAYLKKQKIEKLDMIIATHYDEDHISGNCHP